MRRLGIGIVLLLLTHGLFAQVSPAVRKQAADEFAALNKAFEVEKFSVEMSYLFYETRKDTKPSENKTGSYCKNGKSVYSNMMGIISLRTPNITILANTEEKILILTNPMKASGPMTVGADTLLRLCDDIKMLNLSSTQRKYELKFGDKAEVGFRQIDVIVDTQTHQLKKLVLWFNPQKTPNEDGTFRNIEPWMEITYKNYTTSPSLQPQQFNTRSYVERAGQNYKAIGQFAGYTIYNQQIK